MKIFLILLMANGEAQFIEQPSLLKCEEAAAMYMIKSLVPRAKAICIVSKGDIKT